jgi:hypothetical protein
MLERGPGEDLPERRSSAREAAHADSGADAAAGDAQCWIQRIRSTAPTNFAAGKRPFGVFVTLAEAGEPIAGWIWDPLVQRLPRASRARAAPSSLMNA